MKELLRRIARFIGWKKGSRKAARHAMVGNPIHWELKRRFQRDFLLSTGLETHHYLMDLGCGTLRGGIPLIEFLEAGHYTGIDVRPEVIEQARQELREEGLEHKRPVLIASASGLAKLNMDQRFDRIWVFSVLFHLDDPQFDEALNFISARLHPQGKCYANMNVGDRERSSWGKFPLVWRSRPELIEAAASKGLRIEFVGTLRELGHVTGEAAQDEQWMLLLSK